MPTAAPPEKKWREVMWFKYLNALNAPGESAGLLAAQAEVGVHAAHAISVVFHGYDDTYIEDTIAATPLRLRGSHVCDPSSTPEREVARLALLYDEKGFTGVRFKPNLCAAYPQPDTHLLPALVAHPRPEPCAALLRMRPSLRPGRGQQQLLHSNCTPP